MRSFPRAGLSAVLATCVLLLGALTAGTASVGQSPPATPPWSATLGPVLSSGYNNLDAVTCPSPTSCMAVGASGTAQALMESWNGTAWSNVTPSAPPADSGLSGVSCTSPTSCMAVGSAPGPSTLFLQTLTESWNGTTWSLVQSPDATTTDDNVLNAVSCTSATSCVAVGYYGDSLGVNQILIESWNGTAWSIVPSPDVSTSDFEALWGVKCTSSVFCTAVGVDGSSGENLIEDWNGTAWSIVSSPDEGSGFNELVHVSCTSSTNCTAVGDYFNASEVDQTLIESWNGSGWSIVSSPSEQASNNALKSVSCTSSSSCVAVGYYEDGGEYDGGPTQQTLIEDWNGTAWSLVLSPNLSINDVLSGVAHLGSTGWMAVGNYQIDTESYQALFETAVPLASTTSVISVTSKPVAGEAITIRVEVAAADTTLAPTGQVTVRAGTQHCGAMLAGSDGIATGKFSITERVVGRYSFTASYPGDAAFSSSATTKATSVSVARATSTTTLRLSAASIKRGDEEAEHISVVVAPKFPGVPVTGTVTVGASTTRLCVIKLSSARGSCTLTSKQLGAGTYRLVATYGGDADLLTSASVKETLLVAT